MQLARPLRSPIALPIALLIVGAVCGYAAARAIAAPSSTTDEATRLGGYDFINPLLSCDINEDTPYANFDPLRQQFKQVIAAAEARGDAVRASIYFRSMDTGNWTGVDQNNLYIPASLLKVPLLIAYLREKETSEPALLQERYALPLAPDANAKEYYKPQQPLALGATYSVSDLLQAMIEQSDNNAANVLNSSIATSSIDDVYENFGLPVAPDLTTESISPEEYMRVFRILYNATYLDRSDSQKALEMLSSIDFPEGAVRGLPSNIPFANKFGERTVTSENASGQVTAQKRQLADCGIVYYPHAPYGICIMAEGDDFTKLSGLIAELSRTAYTAVDGGILN